MKTLENENKIDRVSSDVNKGQLDLGSVATKLQADINILETKVINIEKKLPLGTAPSFRTQPTVDENSNIDYRIRLFMKSRTNSRCCKFRVSAEKSVGDAVS
ncbi:hypothetical protein HUT03_00110 [Candidatus Liberibacter africanus]|uniref:Uncharacterized protein n=1 Tax=Candidatus Liberibacter africanus PTSAPSY TaxID=1277257 RepID=A0A0G3I381_LIBAF|nr:hypothetical protein [Candidatus Liberibacter africanus]AKK19685.1 hypothetical protein G293_00105 [Candidatus Liberibacter africanus PTSAPSY]QTP63571.1 hypothetical protein HUT03_00110 [Candidatus Liberibacter africanus]